MCLSEMGVVCVSVEHRMGLFWELFEKGSSSLALILEWKQSGNNLRMGEV